MDVISDSSEWRRRMVQDYSLL
ncbi:unnamed protein product, partial [Adineta steineri]